MCLLILLFSIFLYTLHSSSNSNPQLSVFWFFDQSMAADKFPRKSWNCSRLNVLQIFANACDSTIY